MLVNKNLLYPQQQKICRKLSCGTSFLLVESGVSLGSLRFASISYSTPSRSKPKNKRTVQSDPHVYLLVEPGGVEPPSENQFTRLSTRLVNHLNLPRVAPIDRINRWQSFSYGRGYKTIAQDVGCCVTPKPKPQHSSAGRKLHLGSY